MYRLRIILVVMFLAISIPFAYADTSDDILCASKYPWSQYSPTYSTCICSEIVPDCKTPRADAPDTGTLPRTPAREFRAVWIATYKNIDWPSRPGLSITEQKHELQSMLDRVALYGFNAIVLQVRPIGDAFYASRLVPWSPYLTGIMGKSPGYDPLAFAISEAHRRGLEFHAWLNPFRVGLVADDFTKLGKSTKQASIAHPEITRTYGKFSWLDPSDDRTHTYVLSVVRELLGKYDLDGIHFDDYFYPYRETGTDGTIIDFPDAENYARYLMTGGMMDKDDWRRDRVNTFVRKTYALIKSKKRYVKFGISPFGIWRPGNPDTIEGLDAYSVLYADSRKWLQSGWVDYLSPQLYWTIDSSHQSFPLLWSWWQSHNTRGRYIFPGLSAANVGKYWQPDEIFDQIRILRNTTKTTPGSIFYSFQAFRDNPDFGEELRDTLFSKKTLPPEYSWLTKSSVPDAPLATIRRYDDGSINVFPILPDSRTFSRVLVALRRDSGWETRILSTGISVASFDGVTASLDTVIAGVDRYGRLTAWRSIGNE